MTSPTFLLESWIFVEKRPMMREKSLPWLEFISPTTSETFDCDVTTIQLALRQTVFSASAMDWSVSISGVLFATYWPISSTKKFSLKPGACLSMYALTSLAKSSTEKSLST